MPKISVLAPLDQPLGNRRLLEDLKRCLKDNDLVDFGFTVAFAKVGPLYRLQELIEEWRAAGKTVTGIFGIDHNGTSLQALQFALDHLDNVYYTQYRGHSFHPKLFLFSGETRAVAFIGSNNLTMGGMELNFESAIELIYSLPDEQADFAQVHAMFTSLLPKNCVATRKLTTEALEELDAQGLLLDETKKKTGQGGLGRKVAHSTTEGGKLPVKPASSLPAHIIFGKPPKKKELAKKAEALKAQADAVDITKPLVPVAGFAIQINPHHNGEIFLSKIATNQNPAFFGMPFTGQTKPKKGQNKGYPQRDPDPVCNITVFGKKYNVLYANPSYPLNTVFYTRNKEIRVTASPLVEHVPESSVLVMTPSETAGIDYDMQIFTPASPDYEKWVDVCDQEMPSGGKSVARRFGWF